MMPSTFTPLPESALGTNEREWAYMIAKMPVDETVVLMTKRQLLDFLQTVNVSVGQNYKELSKLPKFAKFGTVSDVINQDSTPDASALREVDQNQQSQPIPSTKAADAPKATEESLSIADLQQLHRKTGRMAGGGQTISLWG